MDTHLNEWFHQRDFDKEYVVHLMIFKRRIRELEG